MSKILHSTLALTAALLLAFSMSATAQTTNNGSADQKASDAGSASPSKTAKGAATSGAVDEQFVKKAAQGDKAEVELGQLALQKASSNEVKKFAQRMVDDHTKNGDELKSVAGSKGITLPDKPEAKEQAEKDRLSKLSGAAFDKAYMAHMVKDHTKDVAEFKKESKNGKDSAIKDYASKSLPTLENHLTEAKSVDQKVKSEKAASSKGAANSGNESTQSAKSSSPKKY